MALPDELFDMVNGNTGLLCERLLEAASSHTRLLQIPNGHLRSSCRRWVKVRLHGK